MHSKYSHRVGRVCADLSSQATIRRRRLPAADQALWLVLGMALFRDEPVPRGRPDAWNICAQGPASDHLLAQRCN
ncbi:hypothetical protein C0J26_12545 [Pseudomonas baetica]|nr:hypothetical protein C0J26_12545 [Pseudomonas baetica]